MDGKNGNSKGNRSAAFHNGLGERSAA